MLLDDRFWVLGSGFKGYNTLILVVFQHATRAERLHPLGKIATTTMDAKLY
jgi:hypothetical protein